MQISSCSGPTSPLGSCSAGSPCACAYQFCGPVILRPGMPGSGLPAGLKLGCSPAAAEGSAVPTSCMVVRRLPAAAGGSCSRERQPCHTVLLSNRKQTCKALHDAARLSLSLARGHHVQDGPDGLVPYWLLLCSKVWHASAPRARLRLRCDLPHLAQSCSCGSCHFGAIGQADWHQACRTSSAQK
jgi:hypothetical protein